MPTAVVAEKVGKKYTIYHKTTGLKHNTIRDLVVEYARKPFNKNIQAGAKEEFWALRDVSFKLKQGERVGFIGANGAGKSTLLKLLSRITEPSEGKISMKGRVACLLEVGTGFHTELTGRENIFLNGAILGMRRKEIQKKFDEIVAFSEIEKFLDTPVKWYSSGMHVRLGFSIAAHLRADILILDEILAVGDAAFQKKSLNKMLSIAHDEGRTILFVSHNREQVELLCNRVLYLKRGEIFMDGNNVFQVLAEYSNN